MELEDIQALPVGELADTDCILFMWTTIPLLKDCFSVMKAWGFEYKTVGFVWIKQNKNLILSFGEWDTGHELMRNFVCLLQKDIQKENPQAFIR